MEEFNNHLKELIEEYDDGEADAASQAPQSRHVRIENKNFFFSCKKNAQGRYITISEVKGNFRNSILSEYYISYYSMYWWTRPVFKCRVLEVALSRELHTGR